jgi:DNA-binding NtrC family response regulator
MPASPAVLIADTSENLCWAIERMLSRRGFRVRTASDPAAVTRTLDAEHAIVLVIAEDLAGGRGLGFLRSIEARHPATAIVVTTVKACAAIAEGARRPGVVACLEKPLDLDRLAEIVDAVASEGAASAIGSTSWPSGVRIATVGLGAGRRGS